MPIFLRIDVDNCYSWKNIFQKGMNKVCLNYPSIAPKINILGFQYYVKNLVTELKEYGIRAGWFYQPYTLSKKDILRSLDEDGHTIGYHAVTTDTLENFKNGLQFLEKHTGKKVYCMSKHGSGSQKLNRFHTPEYNVEKLLEFSMNTDIKLFTGNNEIPDLTFEQHDGTKFMPGIYWINPDYRDTSKYNLEWLINHSEEQNVIVLVHPLRLVMSKVIRNEFTKFLNSEIKIEPFEKLLSN